MTDQFEVKAEEYLFLGEKLESRNELLFDRGCFVYGGYWYDKLTGLGAEIKKSKKEAIIRRILKNDCLEDWQEKLKVMNPNSRDHLNTSNERFLRCYGYEDGKDDWRYFAIEPYISTLYHYCNGLYKGPPLPTEPQVINQMISGIYYMSVLQIPHGDLNPLNVVITNQQQIKLSDFGLSKFSYTKHLSDDMPIEIPPSVIICKRKYWLLDKTPIDPEVIENSSGETFPTEMDDIFAAGCLIFYFLNGGLHPFGDDPESIETNMKEGNLVNMAEMKEEHAELYKVAVENMILQPKNKSRWWRKSIAQFQDALKLKIDRTKLLGEGSFAKVYAGNFHGVAVAVKEIKIGRDFDPSFYERKASNRYAKLNHENVLKTFQIVLSSDENYWHSALELCAATLKEYCDYKYIGPMPTDNMVLYQIANGLDYIYSRDFVHGDLKPSNILISKTVPVQMKVSNFGLEFPTKNSQSETRKYMAPELLKELKSENYPPASVQTDTFSTGCVFFNFLTRGCHPFCSETINEENWDEVKNNVINHNPVGLNNQKGSFIPHFDIIREMISKKEDRINMSEVIRKLATELSAMRKFKEVRNPFSHGYDAVLCFHPTEPIIACAGYSEKDNKKLILLSASNSSIPFNNWNKRNGTPFCTETILAMKWNVDGTLLAVLSFYDIKVFDYPGCKIIFEIGSGYLREDRFEWNQFRPSVLAILFNLENEVYFYDISAVVARYETPSVFCVIRKMQKKLIQQVQWISGNLIALRLNDEIEIYEIDYSEQSNAAQLSRRYDKLRLMKFIKFGPSLLWDQRTKCFAALCEDECVKIWPMEKDNPIHSHQMVDGHCRSLAWNPNGKKLDVETIDKARKLSSNFILTCGLDNGTILIWTPLEEKRVKYLSQHKADVHYLSYSPDGVFLASADCDRKLVIWSTKTWEPVFIGKNEYLFPNISPWMSTINADYKLIFNSTQTKGIISVIEYGLNQSATPFNGLENIKEEKLDGI